MVDERTRASERVARLKDEAAARMARRAVVLRARAKVLPTFIASNDDSLSAI
jgi:hypothetical protein